VKAGNQESEEAKGAKESEGVEEKNGEELTEVQNDRNHRNRESESVILQLDRGVHLLFSSMIRA